MAELAPAPGGPGRVAIVADVRGGVFFGELSKGAGGPQAALGIPYRILFLEASDDDLVNRYEATRRRHPLAPADRVVEGIRKERLMMESLKGEADLILDTSRPDAARAARPDPGGVRRRAAEAGPAGVARLVRLQVRRSRGTPTWSSTSGSCRTRTGSTSSGRCPAPTRRSASTSPASSRTGSSCAGCARCSTSTVPGYVAEGKSYLTIGVGCTGGRHRSVVVADELAEYFREQGFAVDRRAPRPRPRLSPRRAAPPRDR